MVPEEKNNSELEKEHSRRSKATLNTDTEEHLRDNENFFLKCNKFAY